MEMDPKPAQCVLVQQGFERNSYSWTISSLREPEKLIDTITSGLQTYFDKALGTNLLYRFERPQVCYYHSLRQATSLNGHEQYAQIRKQFWTGQDVVIGITEKEMSSIYGAEHLLRMLGTFSYTALCNSTMKRADWGWVE